MELQPVDNTIILTGEEQADNAPFDFVSELLAITLSGRNNELLFEPENVLPAPGIGIETTRSLRVEVDSEDFEATEDKIEITLSGTVENQQKRREVFILYFFMSLDGAIDISMPGGCTKNPGVNPQVIRFENEEEQLNDAVFELSLYCRNTSGQRVVQGQGKGFLFVGQDQSLKVN